jgi:RNA polymerase sigma-70 factor (ECF subfamily)
MPMTDPFAPQNLNDIPTDWTALRYLAGQHGPAEPSARRLQARLLDRYGEAVWRYIRVAFRDPNDAEDVFQEFARKFLSGGFRHADPGRGRFRDYLKTALFHLVQDHKRCLGRLPAQLPEGYPEPSESEDPMAEEEERFRALWRHELVRRAWHVLEARQRRDGLPFAAILRHDEMHPDASSAEIARHFSEKLGRKVTDGDVRKTRMLAHMHLQDAVLGEIEQTMLGATLDDLEEELGELGLLPWCRDAIRRRRERALV